MATLSSVLPSKLQMPGVSHVALVALSLRVALTTQRRSKASANREAWVHCLRLGSRRSFAKHLRGRAESACFQIR